MVILKQLSVDEENTYTPQQLCIVQGSNFVLTFMEHDSDFFNEIHMALKNKTAAKSVVLNKIKKES
ncbi:hypothetical protein [Phocaeicola plebeius]|uniref:hypothetical protein n=1 Tax=Phocaeicola plebeius TaxID=310297 RepID=UPI003FF05CF5